MRPEDVTEENKNKVWSTLYGDMKVYPKPRYKIGDVVRVEKYHPETRFVKRYTVNFLDVLFVITAISRGDPNMCKIQDVDTGEEIKGRFYERELSLVRTHLSENKVKKCQKSQVILKCKTLVNEGEEKMKMKMNCKMNETEIIRMISI